MSAETAFHAALLAHAPLTSLVGSRVAMHAVPAGLQLPYVVFTSRHDPQYTLDNTLACDFVTFEVQCWADSALDAQDVADTVKAAAATAGALVLGSVGAYDAEVGLDAVQLTVEWLE